MLLGILYVDFSDNFYFRWELPRNPSAVGTDATGSLWVVQSRLLLVLIVGVVKRYYK